MVPSYSLIALGLALGVSATPGFTQEGFIPPKFFQPPITDTPAPIVDLGYSQYQGYYNSTFDTHVYLGIRYAAPPERWQMPQTPALNRSAVIQATSNPPRCPQAADAPLIPPFDFDSDVLGDEDCLFLNVFAPANASKLPVMVWIHGGGYGAGSATGMDWSYLDQTVGNGFVSVVIQYRLAAFGFASSAEIARYGIPNAGLRDQYFAIEWVNKYIDRFGGDPDQVTITGESAGGGSVMLQAIANGGNDGTRLFKGIIASSPYLPTQPNYDDPIPTNYYEQLAQRAGCLSASGSITAPYATIFDCLVHVDTITLQNASAFTSYAARYGQWAFIPVTDGKFLQQRPTQQLLKGQVNGQRMLTGNNANEAIYFVPQNITTEAELEAFIMLDYPYLSPENLTAIMKLYAIPDYITASSTKYDSDGLNPPWATEISNYVAGWQQAANNLYSETTFVCPAFWMADAYAAGTAPGRAAWRYQFSVPNAFHGTDVEPLEDDPTTAGTAEDENFRRAFQSLWGRFVIDGAPNLASSFVAAALAQGDNITAAEATSWPAWGEYPAAGATFAGGASRYGLLNLNATNALTTGLPQNADWEVANALIWEDGRLARCALWAELGAYIQQ